MSASKPSDHPVTYEAVKRHKRLWLMEVETGNLVYTPPSWVKLPNRSPMHALAWGMTDRLKYDIDLIMAFETTFNPRLK